MKNFTLSRPDTGHFWKTLILLFSAITLIVISLLAGINDNIPMILILFAGLILFFFAALRYWRNANYYAIMIAVLSVLFITVWYLKVSLGEGITMSVGMISIAGLIAGIIGLSVYSAGWRRLIFISAALSILAIPLLFVSVPPPPEGIYVTPLGEGIGTGVQLLIAVLLLSTVYVNRNYHKLSRTMLVSIALIMILLGLWGLIAPALDKEMTRTFWKFPARIYALVEILSAYFIFSAYRNTDDSNA